MFLFFFQAEDGIRGYKVTGVQTCALPIYRVDKFVVPTGAREEFLERARRTHALLKAQPGFLQDLILEQSSGPGEFNFVTVVEWASQEAVENARAAVMKLHREVN